MMFYNDKMMVLSFMILAAVAQGVKASEPADISLDALSHCPAKVCAAPSALMHASRYHDGGSDKTSEVMAHPARDNNQDSGDNWLPVLNSPAASSHSRYAPILVVGADRFDHQVSALSPPVLSPAVWL